MIGYSFSFDRDTFEYETLKDILEKVMPIKPHKMRIGGKSYSFNIKKLFNYIGSTSGISIYDEEREEQIHFNCFGASKCCVLSIVTKSEKLSKEDIDIIIGKKGFSMGYIYDDDFVTWQMASSIQYYEMRNKDHSLLPKKTNALDTLEIDTSNNYGRMEFYFHTRLMSAPTMYISSYYQKQFPFEKLLNYDKLNHVETIQDERVIKVELFPNPLDSEEKYDLIKNFWEEFQYDALLNEFKNSFD